MSKNNCSCILCHLGRNADFERDLAPVEKVIEVIKGYDLLKSPYPFSEEDRADMIEYATKAARNGTVHFESLEYFWEETGRQS